MPPNPALSVCPSVGCEAMNLSALLFLFIIPARPRTDCLIIYYFVLMLSLSRERERDERRREVKKKSEENP